eukprot:299304_1
MLSSKTTVCHPGASGNASCAGLLGASHGPVFAPVSGDRGGGQTSLMCACTPTGMTTTSAIMNQEMKVKVKPKSERKLKGTTTAVEKTKGIMTKGNDNAMKTHTTSRNMDE